MSVNPPSLLQIIEWLERLAGKLPTKIQKAVLDELTPLKQLLLQQRPPRFLFTGSSKMPIGQIIGALFGSAQATEASDVPLQIGHWYDIILPERGTISVLDARGTDGSAAIQIRDELKYQAADIIFFLDEAQIARRAEHGLDGLINHSASNKTSGPSARIIRVIIPSPRPPIAPDRSDLVPFRPASLPRSNVTTRGPFLEVLRLVPAGRDETFQLPHGEAQILMSTLARELPNQARMEIIRISRNREAQHEVAQLLVKSTTAICAAVGAQPIPLADLPILTSLQLMMISGIMYVSGRGRSFRSAGEFIGALGANVGAAMLLREGTRAILKFFPGWGNVVCGLVAGSATYAIGRAAIVFFIDGVSLKDARRTYLASRKKQARLTVPLGKNGSRS